MTLENEPKRLLSRFNFEELANLVGYVNGHKYWLSTDKKWVIYIKDDTWIIGQAQEIGRPIEVNAWIHTPVVSIMNTDGGKLLNLFSLVQLQICQT